MSKVKSSASVNARREYISRIHLCLNKLEQTPPASPQANEILRAILEFIPLSLDLDNDKQQVRDPELLKLFLERNFFQNLTFYLGCSNGATVMSAVAVLNALFIRHYIDIAFTIRTYLGPLLKAISSVELTPAADKTGVGDKNPEYVNELDTIAFCHNILAFITLLLRSCQNISARNTRTELFENFFSADFTIQSLGYVYQRFLLFLTKHWYDATFTEEQLVVLKELNAASKTGNKKSTTKKQIKSEDKKEQQQEQKLEENVDTLDTTTTPDNTETAIVEKTTTLQDNVDDNKKIINKPQKVTTLTPVQSIELFYKGIEFLFLPFIGYIHVYLNLCAPSDVIIFKLSEMVFHSRDLLYRTFVVHVPKLSDGTHYFCNLHQTTVQTSFINLFMSTLLLLLRIATIDQFVLTRRQLLVENWAYNTLLYWITLYHQSQLKPNNDFQDKITNISADMDYSKYDKVNYVLQALKLYEQHDETMKQQQEDGEQKQITFTPDQEDAQVNITDVTNETPEDITKAIVDKEKEDGTTTTTTTTTTNNNNNENMKIPIITSKQVQIAISRIASLALTTLRRSLPYQAGNKDELGDKAFHYDLAKALLLSGIFKYLYAKEIIFPLPNVSALYMTAEFVEEVKAAKDEADKKAEEEEEEEEEKQKQEQEETSTSVKENNNTETTENNDNNTNANDQDDDKDKPIFLPGAVYEETCGALLSLYPSKRQNEKSTTPTITDEKTIDKDNTEKKLDENDDNIEKKTDNNNNNNTEEKKKEKWSDEDYSSVLYLTHILLDIINWSAEPTWEPGTHILADVRRDPDTGAPLRDPSEFVRYFISSCGMYNYMMQFVKKYAHVDNVLLPLIWEILRNPILDGLTFAKALQQMSITILRNLKLEQLRQLKAVQESDQLIQQWIVPFWAWKKKRIDFAINLVKNHDKQKEDMESKALATAVLKALNKRGKKSNDNNKNDSLDKELDAAIKQEDAMREHLNNVKTENAATSVNNNDGDMTDAFDVSKIDPKTFDQELKKKATTTINTPEPIIEEVVDETDNATEQNKASGEVVDKEEDENNTQLQTTMTTENNNNEQKKEKEQDDQEKYKEFYDYQLPPNLLKMSPDDLVTYTRNLIKQLDEEVEVVSNTTEIVEANDNNNNNTTTKTLKSNKLKDDIMVFLMTTAPIQVEQGGFNFYFYQEPTRRQMSFTDIPVEYAMHPQLFTKDYYDLLTLLTQYNDNAAYKFILDDLFVDENGNYFNYSVDLYHRSKHLLSKEPYFLANAMKKHVQSIVFGLVQSPPLLNGQYFHHIFTNPNAMVDNLIQSQQFAEQSNDTNDIQQRIVELNEEHGKEKVLLQQRLRDLEFYKKCGLGCVTYNLTYENLIGIEPLVPTTTEVLPAITDESQNTTTTEATTTTEITTMVEVNNNNNNNNNSDHGVTSLISGQTPHVQPFVDKEIIFNEFGESAYIRALDRNLLPVNLEQNELFLDEALFTYLTEMKILLKRQQIFTETFTNVTPMTALAMTDTMYQFVYNEYIWMQRARAAQLGIPFEHDDPTVPTKAEALSRIRNSLNMNKNNNNPDDNFDYVDEFEDDPDGDELATQERLALLIKTQKDDKENKNDNKENKKENDNGDDHEKKEEEEEEDVSEYDQPDTIHITKNTTDYLTNEKASQKMVKKLSKKPTADSFRLKPSVGALDTGIGLVFDTQGLQVQKAAKFMQFTFDLINPDKLSQHEYQLYRFSDRTTNDPGVREYESKMRSFEREREFFIRQVKYLKKHNFFNVDDEIRKLEKQYFRKLRRETLRQNGQDIDSDEDDDEDDSDDDDEIELVNLGDGLKEELDKLTKDIKNENQDRLDDDSDSDSDSGDNHLDSADYYLHGLEVPEPKPKYNKKSTSSTTATSTTPKPIVTIPETETDTADSKKITNTTNNDNNVNKTTTTQKFDPNQAFFYEDPIPSVIINRMSLEAERIEKEQTKRAVERLQQNNAKQDPKKLEAELTKLKLSIDRLDQAEDELLEEMEELRGELEKLDEIKRINTKQLQDTERQLFATRPIPKDKKSPEYEAFVSDIRRFEAWAKAQHTKMQKLMEAFDERKEAFTVGREMLQKMEKERQELKAKFLIVWKQLQAIKNPTAATAAADKKDDKDNTEQTATDATTATATATTASKVEETVIPKRNNTNEDSDAEENRKEQEAMKAKWEEQKRQRAGITTPSKSTEKTTTEEEDKKKTSSSTKDVVEKKSDVTVVDNVNAATTALTETTPKVKKPIILNNGYFSTANLSLPAPIDPSSVDPEGVLTLRGVRPIPFLPVNSIKRLNPRFELTPIDIPVIHPATSKQIPTLKSEPIPDEEIWTHRDNCFNWLDEDPAVGLKEYSDRSAKKELDKRLHSKSNNILEQQQQDTTGDATDVGDLSDVFSMLKARKDKQQLNNQKENDNNNNEQDNNNNNNTDLDIQKLDPIQQQEYHVAREYLEGIWQSSKQWTYEHFYLLWFNYPQTAIYDMKRSMEYYLRLSIPSDYTKVEVKANADSIMFVNNKKKEGGEEANKNTGLIELSGDIVNSDGDKKERLGDEDKLYSVVFTRKEKLLASIQLPYLYRYIHERINNISPPPAVVPIIQLWMDEMRQVEQHRRLQAASAAKKLGALRKKKATTTTSSSSTTTKKTNTNTAQTSSSAAKATTAEVKDNHVTFNEDEMEETMIE